MQFLEVEWLTFVLLLHILRLLELLESQCMGPMFGQGQARKRVMDRSACWIMSGALKSLQETSLAEEQTFQTNQPLVPVLQQSKCGWYRHCSREQQSGCQRMNFLRTKPRADMSVFSVCLFYCTPLAMILISNAYGLRTVLFLPSFALGPNGLLVSPFPVGRFRRKKSTQARNVERRARHRESTSVLKWCEKTCEEQDLIIEPVTLGTESSLCSHRLASAPKG